MNPPLSAPTAAVDHVRLRFRTAVLKLLLASVATRSARTVC